MTGATVLVLLLLINVVRRVRAYVRACVRARERSSGCSAGLRDGRQFARGAQAGGRLRPARPARGSSSLIPVIFAIRLTRVGSARLPGFVCLIVPPHSASLTLSVHVRHPCHSRPPLSSSSSTRGTDRALFRSLRVSRLQISSSSSPRIYRIRYLVHAQRSCPSRLSTHLYLVSTPFNILTPSLYSPYPLVSSGLPWPYPALYYSSPIAYSQLVR